MTAEQNKAVVRRFLERIRGLETWDDAVVAEFFAPTYRRHLTPTTAPLTAQEHRDRATALRAAFPDARVSLDDLIADHDMVTYRLTIRGTHRGTFLGIPATHRPVTVSFIAIVRLEDGKFAEEWGGLDQTDLRRQLGDKGSADARGMPARLQRTRARIGVLVPPGNPTVEPELYRMAPTGVTFHFSRLDAGEDPGEPGGAAGMEARNRAHLVALDAPVRSLAAVSPAVVLLAHTGSSYANGFENEPALIERLAALAKTSAATAASAIRAALEHLGVKRLALGTPYPVDVSTQGKAYWQAAGFEVVGYHRLEDVTNIYSETEERAYALARQANTPAAEAVLISGTGLPTVGVLQTLEQELGKPVLSSTQAMLWQALRAAGVRQAVQGFGRLLAEP